MSVASDVPTVAATLDMLTSCYELVPRAEDYAYTIDQASSYTARVNDVVLYESASEHEVVSAIELDIYDRVMRAAQGRWLVHAATLAHDDRGLVLVGASGAGKSTMALALVAKGASYVTDEMTLIDERGVCRGLGRPLTLESRPDAMFTQGMRVAVAGSGAAQSVWVAPPPERRSVTALERHTWVHLSQGPGELRRLTSGEALVAFWGQSLTTDARALAIATDVVSGMPAYAVRGQSIAESAELLESLLAGPGGSN
ncbi:MAG TPA: hypothetical protein VLC93_05090 [Myxococcota bacterium]|nr:hypothetical protein [Myxococcota bacterium]